MINREGQGLWKLQSPSSVLNTASQTFHMGITRGLGKGCCIHLRISNLQVLGWVLERSISYKFPGDGGDPRTTL